MVNANYLSVVQFIPSYEGVEYMYLAKCTRCENYEKVYSIRPLQALDKIYLDCRNGKHS